MAEIIYCPNCKNKLKCCDDDYDLSVYKCSKCKSCFEIYIGEDITYEDIINEKEGNENGRKTI